MTKFVINIEKLITNNRIKKDYQIVKEMEDTLTDIYKKNLDNDILDNDESLILEVSNNKYNISLYNDKFNINMEELEKYYDKLVFTGSYIRSVLMNTNFKKTLIEECKNMFYDELFEEKLNIWKLKEKKLSTTELNTDNIRIKNIFIVANTWQEIYF